MNVYMQSNKEVKKDRIKPPLFVTVLLTDFDIKGSNKNSITDSKTNRLLYGSNVCITKQFLLFGRKHRLATQFFIQLSK